MMWLKRILIRRRAAGRRPGPDDRDAQPQKWLPVIDTDSCTGCRRCVEACDRQCLEMIWEFATLVDPARCDSEGGCAAACPHGVIQMKWAPSTGDPQVGQWRATDAS
jgi:ferredoxin